MKKKLFVIFLLSLISCAVTIWLLQPEKQKEPQRPVPIKVEVLPREALLYFADPEGRYLVTETQQISGCNEDKDCIKNMFSALVSGPQTDLLPILSSRVVVLGVELRDDLALVDFNSAFVHSHPGGSLSELLTVYGLANSLTVNFPYLKQLQILVEGQTVASLKGHISLINPIKADFSYSNPPRTGAPEEKSDE
ncbi:MAG TPA: GerMN domain-containing protein [Geopsychrobacteraceae bacterium]|nr:GerMN domain-containing protein [Geopsychrobacteraceae bacterium]